MRREHGRDRDARRARRGGTARARRGSDGCRGPGRANTPASRRARRRRRACPSSIICPRSAARRPSRGPGRGRASSSFPIAKIRSSSSVAQRVALAAPAAAEVHADAGVGHAPRGGPAARPRRASPASCRERREADHVRARRSGHRRDSTDAPSVRYAGVPMTTRREYRLISADSHVNEPPDLWTDRVPAAMRDRAPRIERFDEGDAWVIEGVTDPINFGMNACAGLEPEEMQGWVALRGHPPRRLRPGGAARRDGPRRRRRRGAVPDAAAVAGDRRQPGRRVPPRDACGRTTTGSPSTSSTRPSASAAWRCCPTAVPRRPSPRSTACSTGPGMRGVVMGCYPNGTLDASSPRTTRCGAASPSAACPLGIHVSLAHGDAGGAQGQAARLRAFLRRAEPHDRADLLRRVRPLPRRSTSCSPRSTSAGCRTSRSRSTTTTSGSTR